MCGYKRYYQRLKKSWRLIWFSNLNETHEIFRNKNKKVFGKFKIETPKNIWIDEFVWLRSKKYAFKCGDYSENKLKGFSKSYSKNINFEICKKMFRWWKISKRMW